MLYWLEWLCRLAVIWLLPLLLLTGHGLCTLFFAFAASSYDKNNYDQQWYPDRRCSYTYDQQPLTNSCEEVDNALESGGHHIGHIIPAECLPVYFFSDL